MTNDHTTLPTPNCAQRQYRGIVRRSEYGWVLPPRFTTFLKQNTELASVFHSFRQRAPSDVSPREHRYQTIVPCAIGPRHNAQIVAGQAVRSFPATSSYTTVALLRLELGGANTGERHCNSECSSLAWVSMLVGLIIRDARCIVSTSKPPSSTGPTTAPFADSR